MTKTEVGFMKEEIFPISIIEIVDGCQADDIPTYELEKFIFHQKKN